MIDPFDEQQPFEQKAIELFELQRKYNPVYARFVKALGKDQVSSVEDIPLLPIQAFKEQKIVTPETEEPELFFQSSGTTAMKKSRHYLVDKELYRRSIIRGMSYFYELDDLVVWAYTPGYAQNPHSSLIWMLKELVRLDHSGLSRFLNLNKPLVQSNIDEVREQGKKLMVFGAAFGLLDLLEISSVTLPEDAIIMETGGMKTFRREMSREVLHRALATGFGLSEKQIHSEYGMTELLSQAYSQGGKWFECVPWMKVTIRNPKSPLETVPYGEEGLIGILDLANVHSCAFILTGDKGILREDGRFQISGRWNPRDLRGCNFLIDQD